MTALGKNAVRLIMFAILGGSLFLLGITIGYNHRPEIDQVMGVINIEQDEPAGTTTDNNELKTCIDQHGVEVQCVLSRDEISERNDAPADFDQFWKAWNVINEKFVPTKKSRASNQEKVWGAISGLADSLGDPYTFFLPPQEKSLFEQDVQGTFGGVGMQIGVREGKIAVIAPLKGSPSERAGIKKGDWILSIDNATTSDMTIDKALYLIRGEVGKSVTLTLLRDGDEKPFTVSVVREVIQVPTIDSEVKDGVFVIRLYGFPATGSELFRKELRAYVESNSRYLVLDLRGNPGGYLEVAVDMASWFLPAGKVVVRQEEKDGPGTKYMSRGYDVFSGHMVILVDGGSASAAEILAGALQDHGVATIVGTKTFGKGSVQELIPITDDTALKVTVARWIMPNGRSLSDGGIEPDVAVEITKEQVEAGEDPQLDKAIELAKKGGRLEVR